MPWRKNAPESPRARYFPPRRILLFGLGLGLLFIPPLVPPEPWGAPAGALPASETDETVAVIRVIDGDTIEVAGGELVRYIGIDAPEMRRRINGRWVQKPEPWAAEALEFNRSRVARRQVRLEFDRERRDRYRRLLAYVHVDGRMVNAELIRAGLAAVTIHPPNLRHAADFNQLEQGARSAHLGIWAQAPPPKWDRRESTSTPGS